jgi:type I restriction enzyme, S subunit
LSDVFEESKIAGDENSSADKRITVRLNLKGIEKREFKGTEAEHATYFFKRKAGQFIYGKQNLHKGAFGIIPKELDGYESSSDIPTFDFKSGYDPKYILYYFSRPSFYEKLEDISTGTGSKRIQPKELFKVKIYAPPIKEQLKIVSILDTAKAELQHYQQKLAQLQLQKKGLMQLLLTGKIITV